MGNEIGTVFERRGQIPRNQVDSNWRILVEMVSRHTGGREREYREFREKWNHILLEDAL